MVMVMVMVMIIPGNPNLVVKRGNTEYTDHIVDGDETLAGAAAAVGVALRVLKYTAIAAKETTATMAAGMNQWRRGS